MKVPEHLDWMFWRPVLEGCASAEEIDRHYDLIDLLDINEALDLRDEAEAKAAGGPKGRG